MIIQTGWSVVDFSFVRSMGLVTVDVLQLNELFRNPQIHDRSILPIPFVYVGIC